jgi:hypothetical protein
MNCIDLMTAPSLVVATWDDPIVERHGFGPASSYVEHCWLPVLGPTATWLYRRLAMPLLSEREWQVDPVDLAVSLGLGEAVGRNAPISRAIGRLVRFHVAEWRGNRLLVRRALAPLNQAQLSRLSYSAYQHHRLVIGGAEAGRRA